MALAVRNLEKIVRTHGRTHARTDTTLVVFDVLHKIYPGTRQSVVLRPPYFQLSHIF